jgi:type IV secretory pathway TraG/TraD family ATPase VirD4
VTAGPVRGRGGYPPPGEVGPWLAVGGLAAALAGWALVWLGGTLGAAVSGGGWDPPGFGIDSAARLLSDGPAAVWPRARAGAVVAGAAAAVTAGAAAVTVAAVWAVGRFGPRWGLARRGELRDLLPSAMTARARRLRPSLASERRVAPGEAGLLIGELPAGPPVYASWEDTILAVMGPRAGKSNALAAQAVLGAPGPVLLTSNKADVYAVTAARRTGHGRVWVFDPQRIAHVPAGFWWDALADATSMAGARRLAGHLVVAAIPDAAHRKDFWISASHNLLTALFHAAAASAGSISDVLAWLADSTDREPVGLLRRADAGELAAQLAGTIGGAVETREGIYETARQCVAPLLDPTTLAWVTRRSGMPQFRPEDFVARPDALYLLCNAEAGAPAGLVAALADSVIHAAIAAAQRAGGRLDPPLVAVLDEASNITKIADLPQYYSHLGSRGIVPLTILQSFRQGVGVWGAVGMDAMWSASTVKVLGAGLDDADFAERVSRLVGEHRVVEYSVSSGRGYGRGWSRSTRPERILTPGQVREIPKGHALLLATGLRPAWLRLRPWYADRRLRGLAADADAETRAITSRALEGERGWRH